MPWLKKPLTENTKSTKKKMNENEVSEKIIGLAIKVHSALGPGLLESAYEKALVFELSRNGYKADTQKSISINYKGIILAQLCRNQFPL